MTTTAAAGWYPDPDAPPSPEPTRLRWWDGTAWTEEVHDVAPGAVDATRVVPAWPGASEPEATAPVEAVEQVAPPSITDVRCEQLIGTVVMPRGAIDVFAGVVESSSEAVAVKVVRGPLDVIGQQRFERQQVAVARLEGHAGIVPVRQRGFTADDRAYVVVPRGASTLEDELRAAGRFEPAEAVATVVAVADTLHHAHVHGVLHRDLRLASVRRDEAGRPLIDDLGLAGVAHVGDRLPPTTAVAPEIRAGVAGTIASDVYGLGAMLYLLLEGTAPPESGRPGEVAEQLATVAPSVRSAVGAALAAEPWRRPPSAAALGALLRAAAEELAEGRPVVPVMPVAAPEPAVLAPVAAASHEPVVAPPEATEPLAGAEAFVGTEAVDRPPSGRSLLLVVSALVLLGLAAGVWLVGRADDGDASNDAVEAVEGDGGDPEPGAGDAATGEAADGTTGDGDGQDRDGQDGDGLGGDDAGTAPAPLELSDLRAQVADETYRVSYFGCGRGGMATASITPDGQLVTGPDVAAAGWLVEVRSFADGEPVLVAVVGRTPEGLALLSPVDGLLEAPAQADPVAIDQPVAVFGLTRPDSIFPAEAATVTAIDGNVVTIRTDMRLAPTIVGGAVYDGAAGLVGTVVAVDGTELTVSTVPSVEAAFVETCGSFESATDGSTLLGGAELRSHALAQELAAALAAGDWPRVRELEPDKADLGDAELEQGFGPLVRSTLVPVGFSGTDPYRLRMLLVAHEESDSGPVTRPFCVTWDVDLMAGTIDQTGLDTVPLLVEDGWVDPAQLREAAIELCS